MQARPTLSEAQDPDAPHLNDWFSTIRPPLATPGEGNAMDAGRRMAFLVFVLIPLRGCAMRCHCACPPQGMCSRVSTQHGRSAREWETVEYDSHALTSTLCLLCRQGLRELSFLSSSRLLSHIFGQAVAFPFWILRVGVWFKSIFVLVHKRSGTPRPSVVRENHSSFTPERVSA